MLSQPALEAHLDALRIAGEAALDLAAATLADPELEYPGLAAAVVIVLLEPAPKRPYNVPSARQAVAGLLQPSGQLVSAQASCFTR